VELVALDEITSLQWSEIVAGERNPWGGLAEGFVWGDKQHNIGLCDDDGRLVAVAGALTAEVEIEGAESFQVVGIGGVFVTQRERGSGLVWKLLGPLLEIAAAMGPDRAMLFCRAPLRGLYAQLTFAEIAAPVWVQQPDGRVEMPLCAMWRPLRGGVRWPEGVVDVRGLPF
jgi:predicted GNAT family N-acyltransferase